MKQRVLVTAGLPYANGSLHLGHLVEYCQADMYVRSLRLLGEDAIYICASDTHGTPIELNAQKQKITPEALVARYHDEHQRDFARFDVRFDHFGSTHNAANRRIVEEVYGRLRKNNQIDEREIDGNWCEKDQRFLPDRFIKGTCPRCGALDQYGDVCEACGATYSSTDLVAPHCALCGTTPVTKKSRHLFFRLSAKEHVDFLRQWIDSNTLQSDVANYVRNWIEGGLRDWCITRDGPYFGFAVPEMPGKYFYVWLDAPLGYVAASAEWAEKHNVPFDALWHSDKTRIEHVIGKDIVYFHTLFWPAVLRASGYTLPSKVHVHGMLTVNGEKMSKTRGTFINAAVFAEHVDPQALRYYYACKYSSQSDDLDLSLEDFVMRVNGELVNKHANLFSRASQFLTQRLEGRLGDLPFTASEAQAAPAGDGSLVDAARQVVAAGRRIEDFYRQRELGRVVRELNVIADIGNELMQSRKPWDEMKSDPEVARVTLTMALNICHALAMYLAPIVPRFAEAGARGLGSTIDRMDATTLFRERNRSIGPFERLFERLEPKQIEAIVSVSTQAGAPDAASAPQPVPSPTTTAEPLIAFEDFQKLELRVGTVKEAERLPKSKKLLRLKVDLGEAEPRQIVAGIATHYEPEAMIGRQVVVLANLKPAKLMGVESQGMVLAAEAGESLALLTPSAALPAGSRIH